MVIIFTIKTMALYLNKNANNKITNNMISLEFETTWSFDKVWGVPSRRHVAPSGNPCLFMNRTPFCNIVRITHEPGQLRCCLEGRKGTP